MNFDGKFEIPLELKQANKKTDHNKTDPSRCTSECYVLSKIVEYIFLSFDLVCFCFVIFFILSHSFFNLYFLKSWSSKYLKGGKVSTQSYK